MARNDDRKFKRPEENDGFDKKLVEIRRVTKVVKGGRTLRFSALIIMGNRNGKVGLGLGKAGEVSVAVEKATQAAKKNLFDVCFVNGTIPHDIIGKFGSTTVHMIPAKEGNGVIAGGAARSVLELAGIKDITAKTHGSNNKINCAKATINGLKSLRTAEQVAALRGKTVEEII